MERPNRSLAFQELSKGDKPPDVDEIPNKKTLNKNEDNIHKPSGSNNYQETTVHNDWREGSSEETFERVIEERDVYSKEGILKAKIVVVEKKTVHKSIKVIEGPEHNKVTKPALHELESSRSRSSSYDSLSSPTIRRKVFTGTKLQFDNHIEEIKSK
ncbi:uncharacterized protein LOC126894091 [Daktulosphaira vitifoliae]|uniref:uncharacterized protein LOC126894091 n=1 Tax=Daktulosphaira vitifoliae TaxID=58002 RepID=UPI0021A9D7D9|nr:uncharacterized protein LOC126894091 [Daktulosphaira vitifoliae]